ncbi:deoxynucleoside kinase [Salmonella enterica]|uniref:deoxynucleoside kinase n=1 Tax=Salmonella enterica TaxID=28901 RepID=UPI0011BF18B9|nr:deoxynucleoside kinase [Salmonella enterica]TXC15801.1 hypothetical protein DP148_26560 [Salmonella enterica subsp. enterica serovar Typhimurium]
MEHKIFIEGLPSAPKHLVLSALKVLMPHFAVIIDTQEQLDFWNTQAPHHATGAIATTTARALDDEAYIMSSSPWVLKHITLPAINYQGFADQITRADLQRPGVISTYIYIKSPATNSSETALKKKLDEWANSEELFDCKIVDVNNLNDDGIIRCAIDAVESIIISMDFDIVQTYKDFDAIRELHHRFIDRGITAGQIGRNILEMIKIPKKKTCKIYIEGNIGSGKSTIIQGLQLLLGDRLQLREEPVQQWANYKGVNMLEKLYTNPADTIFDFQMMVLQTVSPNMADDKVAICERSLYSGLNVFIENAHASGILAESPKMMLCDYIKGFLHTYKKKHTDWFIYVRSPPSTCVNRITQRHAQTRNKWDNKIGESFVRDIHALHETWLMEKERNVVVINTESVNLYDILEKAISAVEYCYKSAYGPNNPKFYSMASIFINARAKLKTARSSRSDILSALLPCC